MKRINALKLDEEELKEAVKFYLTNYLNYTDTNKIKNIDFDAVYNIYLEKGFDNFSATVTF